MTKCVLKVQLEMLQIPHDLFGPSPQIIWDIFEKRPSSNVHCPWKKARRMLWVSFLHSGRQIRFFTKRKMLLPRQSHHNWCPEQHCLKLAVFVSGILVGIPTWNLEEFCSHLVLKQNSDRKIWKIKKEKLMAVEFLKNSWRRNCKGNCFLKLKFLKDFLKNSYWKN